MELLRTGLRVCKNTFTFRHTAKRLPLITGFLSHLSRDLRFGALVLRAKPPGLGLMALILRVRATMLAFRTQILGQGAIILHSALEFLGHSRDLVAQLASDFSRLSRTLGALHCPSSEHTEILGADALLFSGNASAFGLPSLCFSRFAPIFAACTVGPHRTAPTCRFLPRGAC